MTTIRAVLFDAGDVIYFRPRRGQAIKGFLAQRGLNLHPRIAPLLKESYYGRISQEDYFRARLKESGLNDATALEEGIAIMVRAQSDIELFDGVPATLHDLKAAKLKLGIVTNTNDPTARKMQWFARHGIEALWDGFATSCEINTVKPEAAIYLAALAPMGLTAQDAVFVGHSRSELAGAKALGIRTISFNADSDEVRGDQHATNFADLLQLVKVGS
jgi:HAD superfamily hydrolase (TIGR01509 family)